MATPELSREAVRRGATSVRAGLGQADKGRLDTLLDAMGDDGRIRLHDAIAGLFPGRPRETALALFRQFRERLRTAASKAGVALVLAVDGQNRAKPEDRWCWFIGDDAVDLAAADHFSATAASQLFDTTAAEQHADAETAGVRRSGQDAVNVEVESLRRPVEPAPVPQGTSDKRLVHVFISYAHDDSRAKTDLITRLRRHLGSLKRYKFEFWDDGGIRAGSRWSAKIKAEIESCDFGLLLVSPAFLDSRFIVEKELPYFAPSDAMTEPRKASIPVALKRFRDDEHVDLHGLEHLQIVYHPVLRKRTFQDAEGDRARDGFAAELSRRITEALEATPVATTRPVAPSSDTIEDLLDDSITFRLGDIRYIHGDGRISAANKQPIEPVTTEPAGERRDAIDFLMEWACDPNGQPCCALLGDYGIGKTTTSMAFTQELLRARATDRTVPLPIYLDLRTIGEAGKGTPELKRIIDTALRANWRSGQTDTRLTADEVIRCVQQDGALVIYDGLDEVLVHLSPIGGQRFTRELFRILPPALWPRRRKPDMPGRPGRILITCRTHYFRTLRDQQTHLTAEDRDDLRGDDYRVFILLPFTDDQIRAYLRQTLPESDVDRALATIGAVHNLTELAQRPYTLSLIARHFPDIERWKLEGRTVTGAVLYRHMVLSWLERDAGKHQLTPDHKQLLMEHFAAALHRAGKRAWSVGDLEQWLIDFLRARPDLAAHYEGKDRELLKEDLRTATFLVREGATDFRFAHTSLQEFFLAAYLHRALLEGRTEAWDMAQPSPETLDFLGQLLAAEPDAAPIATLQEIGRAYRPRVSELAFAYVLMATRKAYPTPPPAAFVLNGAELPDWEITAPADAPPLNLRGASFRNACLRNAVFRHVELSDADFTGAGLQCTELNHGVARATRFDGADLTGSVFRDLDLTGATFDHGRQYRTQFLRCTLSGARGIVTAPPAGLFALCRPENAYHTDTVLKEFFGVLTGHTGMVLGCAFFPKPAAGLDPGGVRIVSASSDNTLRIWDAETGTCLRVLEGHTRSVNGCAVAPDGRRIVSAASANTLRIWDAETGEEAAFRVHLLPDGEYVSLTPQSDRVLHASPEAWRSLGCLAPGPDGKTIRYPAEIFGELPP